MLIRNVILGDLCMMQEQVPNGDSTGTEWWPLFGELGFSTFTGPAAGLAVADRLA